MIVYKYLHPDRVDVLRNCAIRFSQPSILNDPFEALPCFTGYREHLRQDLIRQRVEKFGPESATVALDILDLMIDAQLHAIPEALGEHFGVLSLSRTRSSLLMWGHYADSHHGFVIGFDDSNIFFEPGNGKAIDGLRPVKYSKQRARIPGAGLRQLTTGQLNTANEGWFFTKSCDWKYEEEMRILAMPKAADVTIPTDDGCDICLFKFPPAAVVEVILGMQMPPEKLDTLIDLCRNNYPSARLSIASLNSESFAVDVKPVRLENIAAFKVLAAT